MVAKKFVFQLMLHCSVLTMYVMIWLCPYTVWRFLLAFLGRDQQPADTMRPWQVHIIHFLIASQPLNRFRCLQAGLGGCLLLRCMGIPASIKLGARQPPVGGFHAWVEVDSTVVIGERQAGYQLLTAKG